MPKISAVIPTMNEENTIGNVIEGLKALEDIEILVVDTNSKDRTKQIASSEGARVIDQPLRGYGLAYKTGLNQASGDIIVCMDGDGTYPTDIVTTLIDLLVKDDVDFISCDRMSLRNNENYTTLHFVGNSVLNITIRLFFKHSMKDSQSGMWIFKSGIYRKMGHLSDGMSFSQEIKIEAMKKGRFIEVPIRYGVRITKPKLKTWGDGISNLMNIFIKMTRK
ncbi:MAG: glycosyltransferase family 2 protein [Candidatus Thermoplasmatota archaeon]|jgi:glycosyltransferase involved in cell wall biosynthesis|nr:glycosyltransferase family 2 protein [Candidatus Thermoplasmatota archaeon]